MKDDKYITPNYETIGLKEKITLCELCQSSIINGFSIEDYQKIINVFNEVVDRLCNLVEKEKGEE